MQRRNKVVRQKRLRQEGDHCVKGHCQEMGYNCLKSKERQVPLWMHRGEPRLLQWHNYVPLLEAEVRRAIFELNLGQIDLGLDVKLDGLINETDVLHGVLVFDWILLILPVMCISQC
ncbi:unnamed protein product [Peronospora destructor]|uniref:Uncharacterized protein n=1 Tax=Peronospora destructor TaxID=86335 RepID=A0AAV0V5X1_9STRA|nr:unnamed protein product [Peronospora destructor]